MEEDHWVIWNGSLGVVDTVTIGEIEMGSKGRNAWLDEPYDMVGPFCLHELKEKGLIHFAACIVMSRQKWQENQVQLRSESIERRRETQRRRFEERARFHQRRSKNNAVAEHTNEKRYRESLNLPITGALKKAEIKAAYRRVAQKSHPDMGGNHEQFIFITKARDALLAFISSC
ncbi:MAG: hypothetical protein MI976_12965 [Pseudomonadales bacterium]|nr:hypothetical protein [Pseudomonadales bacterium]